MSSAGEDTIAVTTTTAGTTTMKLSSEKNRANGHHCNVINKNSDEMLNYAKAFHELEALLPATMFIDVKNTFDELAVLEAAVGYIKYLESAVLLDQNVNTAKKFKRL
eukprot:gene17712-19481_t